jgi:2'-5' RNA ligase
VSGGDTVRAFVAFEMPDRVREMIRRERRHLEAELPRARWTRPEGQHLTLKFLGEATTDRLARLTTEMIARAADLPAVAIGLRGAGFFPSARRPRVAWIGGEADGGAAVAAAVESAAQASGFGREERGWSLHLTQARLERGWPRSAVETYLEWGRGLALDVFTCREIVLYQSELRPGGAVYTSLERIPLG